MARTFTSSVNIFSNCVLKLLKRITMYYTIVNRQICPFCPFLTFPLTLLNEFSIFSAVMCVTWNQFLHKSRSELSFIHISHSGRIWRKDTTFYVNLHKLPIHIWIYISHSCRNWQKCTASFFLRTKIDCQESQMLHRGTFLI